MVDSDSQKDQGGNPLGEGTIMGRDGEKPIWKRDNYMHSKVADFDSTVREMEKYHDGVNGYGQGDFDSAEEWLERDFRIGDQWFDGTDGDPVPGPPILAALVTSDAWTGHDPLDEIRCPDCGGDIMQNKWGTGLFCANCNHSWPVHKDMPKMDYVPSRPADFRDITVPSPVGLPSQPQYGHVAGEIEDILGIDTPPPQKGFMAWTPGMHGRGLVINGEPHTWNAYDPTRVDPFNFKAGDLGTSHSEYIRKLGINPNLADMSSGVEIRPSGEIEPLTGRDPMPYIQADPRLKPLEKNNGDIFSVQPTMQPVTTASASRTLNMDPYMPWTHEADVQFEKGPDANVPQHKITVQPGPLGIHAGHTKYLRFLDAHVNGVPARQNAGQIISRYGLSDSPEFGQPVEIGVHDPAHIAPIVEQIQSSQGAVATPLMRELGHKIQSGQLPPPPGIDPSTIAPVQQPQQVPVVASAHTAGVGPQDLLLAPLAEGAAGMAEGAGGGGLLSGGLGSVAPSLMKGALFRQGENMIGGGGGGSPAQAPTGESGGSGGPQELSQLAAILVADYETPSSNKDVGTKHDDPEDVDQKEFNDKESDPNPKNPNLEDSGASGEDEVRDKAGFGPDSPGIERLGLLLPLVLHYFHSAESGADDPMIKGLHEVLESENPGYLDNVTPEDEQTARTFIDQLGKHPHDKSSKVALVPGMQNLYTDPAFAMQQNEQAAGEGQIPGATPPGGMHQQGHCPNCGGVLTADGSCPQCGAKTNPMGGTNIPGQTPMTGGPSMPAQISASYDIIAALVDNFETAPVRTSANHQGPVTPEQIAAVQQLLIKQNRVHEVPNVPLNPGEYSKEMAEIQGNPNVAPIVPEGEQTSPPSPTGGPGGMPMPGMEGAPGPSGGGAPMTPLSHLAADNVAGRCPNCNSASTGMLMDEGGHQRCHSCGNIWKNDNAFTDKSVNKETRYITAAPGEITPDQTQNPSDANAAERHHHPDIENNQDSSLTWKDTEGQPLEAGREYEMHNPSYQIPDIVRIERVKPDGLDVSILGTFSNDPNALAASDTITKEEAQMENLTFTPSAENADQRGESPPGAQTPGDQQIPPSGQTTDEIANSQQMSSSVQKHAPMSEHDQYFGGSSGSAEKALSAMKKEYGEDKGESVFYALVNKRKKSMVTEADIRQAEFIAAQAQGTDNVLHSLNDIPEPEIDDHCPKCGHMTIESSMSSPTTMMHECFRCSNVWETKEDPYDYDGGGAGRSWVLDSSGPGGGDDFFAEMERARAMRAAGQMTSRNLSDIVANDSRQQHIKDYLDSEKDRLGDLGERVSGKRFSPQEQRALIDEEGNARNRNLLQLGGTHYRTRMEEYDSKANGENVPAGHLALGI